MKESNVVTIDVSSIKDRHELHAVLARALGFPDYYGKNWDAFDECIRDFPPASLHVTGVQKLGNALPREAELLKQCLEAFRAEMPGRDVHVS
jgi:ribonuclease inhibitor